jgi:hypothetical protein
MLYIQLKGHYCTILNELIKSWSKCINKGTVTLKLPPLAMQEGLILDAEKKAKRTKNTRHRLVNSPLKQAVNASIVIQLFTGLLADFFT